MISGGRGLESSGVASGQSGQWKARAVHVGNGSVSTRAGRTVTVWRGRWTAIATGFVRLGEQPWASTGRADGSESEVARAPGDRSASLPCPVCSETNPRTHPPRTAAPPELSCHLSHPTGRARARRGSPPSGRLSPDPRPTLASTN